MRFALITGLALGVAACSPSDSDVAVRELQMIRDAHGSRREICNATRKVEAVYLKDGDTAKYRGARIDGEIACLNADMSAAGF